MTMMNASSLFLGSRNLPSYHSAISFCEVARATLVAADKKIRGRIRDAAKEARQSRSRLVALSTRKFLRDHSAEELKLEPRFMWQGSHVYETAIDPAFKPPQQSDLDDGIYFRTSFLEHQDPALASDQMFQFVESALQPLCDEEGWELVKTKNTCVRVIIDRDKHIDLPIYAIPDEEFTNLEKAVARTFGNEVALSDQRILDLLDHEKSLRIPRDRVMLAHRRLKWVASDPLALRDWFEERSKELGPALKRVCRYLKGWRDFAFPNGGGPESITLMVCAVMAFYQITDDMDDTRDDKSVLEVAKRLAGFFRADICNPVLDDGAAPLNDWQDGEREKFVKAAEGLQGKLSDALERVCHPDNTVNLLIETFGKRLPYRPDLVRVEGERKSAPVAAVAATPLAPAVRTTSG